MLTKYRYAFCFLLLVSVSGAKTVNAEQDSKTTKEVGQRLLLSEYLRIMGARLDCYFTVETKPNIVTDKKGRWLQSVYIDSNPIQKSVEELIATLRRNAPDFVVKQDKQVPAIIHLVQASLLKNNNDALDERISLSYKGTPSALVELLSTKTKGAVEQKPVRYLGDSFGDLTTQINFSIQDATLRDILTNYVPLSSYPRILWAGQSAQRKEGLTIRIIHNGGYGQTFLSTSHFDSDGRATRDVKVFSVGEEAFVTNPNTEEVIINAITFINERMKGKSQLNVRWAMFYLGKYKVARAIPTLLKYIDYQYTTTPLIEESYPALRALRQIGKQASDASLAALSTEKDTKRLRLLLRVVMSVNGLDKGQSLVAATLPNVKDVVQRNRVSTELATIVKQIPNDATATVPDEDDESAVLTATVASTKPILSTP